MASVLELVGPVLVNLPGVTASLISLQLLKYRQKV